MAYVPSMVALNNYAVPIIVAVNTKIPRRKKKETKNKICGTKKKKKRGEKLVKIISIYDTLAGPR